jgi:cold shock CspA family protein
VFWKDIKSDDRFPSLNKDMQVEFALGKKKAGNRAQVFAKQVSLPGDQQVSVQDESDANKEFIGDQSSRYTGHLKFFSPKHGFGYIKIDEGQGIDDDVTNELRVETSEVNSGGRHPRHMKDMAVEFGIWKTKKDKHKAYNMTLPGGEPFSAEQVENRSGGADGEEFQGTVKIWCHKFGWGFIEPADESALPDHVKSKIEEMNKATKKKGKKVENEGLLYFRRNDLRKGYRCQKDASVAYQVYTDDKGAGACDIHEA